MALRPRASAAKYPYHWFMKQLHWLSSSASVLETTLESTMRIVAANIYYPAQASTRSPALPCPAAGSATASGLAFCCHFRPPHAISPRKTFFSGWQDMEVEISIGSRETRTFIPCARCTKWRGHGPIGGYPTGAVALAGGSPSLIPRLPSHPIPSHPSPPFPPQFYFWNQATERDLTSVSHLLNALEPGDRNESGELGVPAFFFGRSSRARGAVTFKVGRGRSAIRIF
jgi:hypothetical protein